VLLNVAELNVSIRNIKVSKRKRHEAYSVTAPKRPPPPAKSDGEYFPRVFHVVIPDPPNSPAVQDGKNQGRGRGDLRFDIAH
jgi:hypothetical protein